MKNSDKKIQKINLDFDRYLNGLIDTYNEKRKEKTFYERYSDYTQFFLYTITKRNNIKSLFRKSDKRKHNTIKIYSHDNIGTISEELINFFLKTKDQLNIIFVNIEEENDDFHSMLIIYRKNENKFEHYDPNGYTNHNEYIENLFNKIQEQIPNLIYISSKTLHLNLQINEDILTKVQKENKEKVADILRGFNNLSSFSNISELKDGSCNLWCILIFDLLTYYKTSTEYIIEFINKKFLIVDDYTETRFNFAKLIKGYFFEIFYETKFIMSNDGFYINIYTFHNSIKNDDIKYRKMFDYITDFMNLKTIKLI